MRAPVKMLDLPGYVSLEVHEELRDQLATVEQDAERYRWLRKGDLESMRVIGLPQTEDVYDRELDAEMAKAPHA